MGLAFAHIMPFACFNTETTHGEESAKSTSNSTNSHPTKCPMFITQSIKDTDSFVEKQAIFKQTNKQTKKF
jgi:hypothetical protein